jgi:hypothetical protein
MNDSPKPLSEMRALTEALQDLVSAPEPNIEGKRRLAYELLLGNSTNRDFVERHASHFGLATEPER